jgi:hypothetical protein
MVKSSSRYLSVKYLRGRLAWVIFTPWVFDLIDLCIVGKIFLAWVFSLGHYNDWAKDLGGHILGFNTSL